MLVQGVELNSFGFFQRGSVREMITFFNKTIAKRTPPGQR
jgi:synaptobrevin family protein YKT6